MEAPKTLYAKTHDGLSIAYQVVGDGPSDILLLPYISCIDLMWEEPTFAHVLERVASIGRLICHDARGLGSSDPVPLGALPTPETWMDDILVVLQATASTAVHIIGHSTNAYAGMLFAATYPELVNSLVLIDATARLRWADDYTCGHRDEDLAAYTEIAEQIWGIPSEAGTSDIAPSRVTDTTFATWLARYERSAMSPATLGAFLRWMSGLDVRDVLPTIRVPTCIICNEDSSFITRAQTRYIAEKVPNARLVDMPSGDMFLFSEHADAVLDEIEEFITGAPPVREPDRALATILFTDIVGSTEHLARLGDEKWTVLMDQHDSLVARELDRHRGRKVNTTGDGMLATFDGPARAVRCAQAICEAVRPLGIEIRAGLHTGEVELRGDDIGGIAVHIGQRVSAMAGPGEVFVSRTVTDLVAGSGIAFADRGEHELKGVPGEWAIYAVSR